MKIEDLQPLCHDWAGRGLNQPFIQQGKIYATNGKWCIRMDRTEDFTTDNVSEINVVQHSTIEWDNFDIVTSWITITDIPRDKAFGQCDKCGGSGMVANCGECDGTGEVECEYGHTHTCPECDGDGIETDGTKQDSCDKCDSTGLKRSENKINIGNNNFYIWQLYELMLVLGKLEFPRHEAFAVIPFKFDGGQGLIMHVRI